MEVLTIKFIKKDNIKIYDLDQSNFAVLSNRADYYNLLKYGTDYHIELEEKWAAYFARNFFLVNEDVGCLVLNNTIYLRDFIKEQVIRKIIIEKKSFAIFKNDQWDMVIFSGGNLYQYDFETDKLTKLKHLIPDPSDYSIYYPSPYIRPKKIAYSQKRNSVFYSAFIDPEIRTRGVYEMSLDDYSVTLRGRGFCPQVNNEKNCLYYINDKQDSIIKLNFDTLTEEVLFSYPHAIRDFKLIDEGTIFFVHAAERANIKNVKFDRIKIFIDGEVKYIRTKGTIYGSPFDVVKID